jgi:hypothetical protein
MELFPVHCDKHIEGFSQFSRVGMQLWGEKPGCALFYCVR